MRKLDKEFLDGRMKTRHSQFVSEPMEAALEDSGTKRNL